MTRRHKITVSRSSFRAGDAAESASAVYHAVLQIVAHTSRAATMGHLSLSEKVRGALTRGRGTGEAPSGGPAACQRCQQVAYRSWDAGVCGI